MIVTVFFLAVFLAAVNGYAKEHKQANVFANLRVSASVFDFKGSFLDLGVEKQLIEIYPGVGAGFGAEFMAGKKLSFRLGSDVKIMVGGDIAAVFKFYGGVGCGF